MNDEIPWLNLTQNEVNELRNKKFELTEYGKQKLSKLMENQSITAKVSEEDYNKVVNALNKKQLTDETKQEFAEYGKQKLRKFMNDNYIPDDDVIEEMLHVKLAEEKKEELERMRRRETVLRRYNKFYNEECFGMPHGTPITPEHMQALALECAMDALRCENMNVEYDVIAVEDIQDLIAGLYQQSNEFLERVQQFKDSADGVA